MQTWKYLAFTCAVLVMVSIGANQAAAQPQVKPKTIKDGTDTGVRKPPAAQQREAWRKSLVRAQRPGKGCFTATYPEKTWRSIACGKAPQKPYPPRSGIRPQTVGNGLDFSGQVTGNTSAAEGSFDSVTGVTTESDGTANSFSLQLNTNFFSTTTCSGASVPANCLGWEQFIYENPGGGGSGFAFIQYWLINWNNPCPAGWNTFGGDCFINSAAATAVPAQTIASLNTMKVDGDISDAVTFSLGATLFTAPGDNHFPDLTNGWRLSEFNIVGNGGGSQANFNAGSTIVVRTAVNSGMPGTPPTCSQQGFTGETNNLTLVSAPAMTADVTWPSIVFTQSDQPPLTMASCDSADSIGDTHVTTFDGLYYDFQAIGDFVLAKADNFEVQSRQVSGGTRWPNTAINKGVAAQLGKSRVAVYMEPTRLVVDGRSEDLADGKSILLPDRVQVTRHGNQYFISSENGNSVIATINDGWMNIHVGLGHTPQPGAGGLLGSPGGNGHQLKTINGSVLQEPVAFADLYHGYADGWRVQPNRSLFVEHSAVVTGIPTKPFFANHLNPQDAARARATCKTAGVTVPALLEACTLDNVVLNNTAATKVFVNTRQPRVVLKPVMRETALK